MSKIIITGAGGLVGLNFLSLNENLHSRIIAIEKNPIRVDLIKKLFPLVEAHCIDLNTEEANWKGLFFDANILIQLHAQIHDLDEKPYWDNNVYSIEKVINIAKQSSINHIIHTSSSVVISKSNDLYVQTKELGEKVVIASNIPQTILRPPLMFGNFDYKHLGFLTSLMEKLPILPFPGNGKFIRQPLYVVDLCKIIKSAIDNGPSNKVHNLIGKEQIYFIDLLKIIRSKRKINCILLPLPINLFAFLVKIWGKIFGRAPFVKDQILALTAGDIFPLEDWESEFNVKYTKFDLAFEDILQSKYKNYRSGHNE